MMENDLCQQLVDALFLRCNDDDSWGQTAREKLLLIIRSYANALVAAAVSECAMIAQIPHGCSCEGAPNNQGAAYCHFTTASAIRSIVTSESAAKELERIKNEARLDEHLKLCPRCTRKARRSRGARCPEARALEAAKEK